MSKPMRSIILVGNLLLAAAALPPLNRQLTLTHLNPVLRSMGLQTEDVYVTDSHRICVPVAKNGLFPPEAPASPEP